MRKLFLIAILLFFSRFSYSQITIDAELAIFLVNRYNGSCVNTNNNTLDTACAKLQTSTNLSISFANIQNLNGLQYFTRVENISLSNLPLVTNINNLPPNLKSLHIFQCVNINQIVRFPQNLLTFSLWGGPSLTFPTFPNTLQTLQFQKTQLTQIPNLPPNLNDFFCIDNPLISQIPQLPLSLKAFVCNDNRLITQLPTLPPNLIRIQCNNNNLTSLPNLPSSLTSLWCYQNKLTQLPALPPLLRNLICYKNQLIQLPTLPPLLQELNCDSNQITTIPALSDSLKSLKCSFNEISNLPTLPIDLEQLYCNNNKLISLPAFGNKLRFIIASKNLLTLIPSFNNIPRDAIIRLDNNLIGNLTNKIDVYELDVSNNPINSIGNNLKCYEFNCSNTNILKLPDSLDVTILHCNNNNVPSLPKYTYDQNKIWKAYFSKAKSFTFNPPLNMSNFRILNLDSSSNSKVVTIHQGLIDLSLIGATGITCLPLLKNNLTIFIDSGRISCLPNHPTSSFNLVNTTKIVDSAYNSNGVKYYIYSRFKKLPPICNPTNNINNCQVNPAISSNIYYDYNNNNSKDSNEPFATNIGVRLSSFNRTTTNSNGAFTIYADTIGIQTLTVTAPRFYTAVPNNININLIGYDTSVTLPNIALQVTTLKDSLSTKITPINWAARPGFVYPYLVQYKNVGSTTINATASLLYNNALLNYDSSSNSAVANTGSQLNLALNSFAPGQEHSYIAYFKVKPSGSLLGQILKIYSNIAGGAATATDSTAIIIGGSYDPNDKLSTPQLSTSQVSEGQFINYTIRFQNTGTDTAFTVVIADTLNSLLQANTFEFLGSSHACKTTIQDNKLYFEFRNILLPDSNVNLIASNGFVNFRIKPVSSVVLNTVIPNKGAIYFDYNEPIITNTATTTIRNTILPTHLLGFSAALHSNKTVLLYWNTTNELNTQFFVVEQSTNGKDFTALETITAKGTGNNNYYTNKVYNSLPTELYFRLKTIDKDGVLSYSNIIKIKQASANGWSIVNNPAKGKLLIEVKDKSLENTQARLVNAQGQVVQTISLQIGFNNVNVSTLNKGLYFVQTNQGAKQVVVD
ncbi:MAG: DUF7619 domain-containing protein [Chitinophagaceae bacterium]